MVDGLPENAIPSDVDAHAVLTSPDLLGCYGLKPIAQTKDYSCGAAATATVLRWFNIHGNEHQCMESLGTNPVEGTSWRSIVTYLRRRGLKATAHGNFPVSELISRAQRKLPTLIEWLDWGGHWAVHVGYEPNLKALVFADPARPRSKFSCHSIATFEKHWFAPATEGLDAVPQIGITVDLWSTKQPLRENEHYGTYIRGSTGKRTNHHWSHILMDWGTNQDWAHTHRRTA